MLAERFFSPQESHKVNIENCQDLIKSIDREIGICVSVSIFSECLKY